MIWIPIVFLVTGLAMVLWSLCAIGGVVDMDCDTHHRRGDWQGVGDAIAARSRRYADWINTNVTQPRRPADMDGRKEAEAMCEAFPELAVEEGCYYCPVTGLRHMFWLRCNDGTIVNPTVCWTPSFGQGTYILSRDLASAIINGGLQEECNIDCRA